MACHKVLVADDERNMRRVLTAMLERRGLEVHAVEDGVRAAAALASQPFDLVLTDLRMGGMDGLELLRRVQEVAPDVPVVLITAHGTVDTAVEAMKLGAFDFVTKPFEQDEITAIVDKALKARALASNAARPARALAEPDGAFGMIGRSSAMRAVFDMVRKVASSPSTVLVTGESGTGKELVARALHDHSARKNGPFIKINCAAIPSTLVESELFGHEKGAFTGAVTSKPGRFELAHGGTLFLDEVGEVPLEMQVKLLRVLQESEFERVGGVKTIQVDVRLVTATNLDLNEAIEAGRFREDLFYRLNVVPIHLPALRDRQGDIPLLVRHFLDYYNQRLGKSVVDIEPDAIQRFVGFPWPGNIRQLENMLERTLLFCERTSISVEDLPQEMQREPVPGAPDAAAAAQHAVLDGTGLKQAVRETRAAVERELILTALEQTDGNVTQAAKMLRISRKSLQNKMKELELREGEPWRRP